MFVSGHIYGYSVCVETQALRLYCDVIMFVFDTFVVLWFEWRRKHCVSTVVSLCFWDIVVVLWFEWRRKHCVSTVNANMNVLVVF